MGNNVVVFIADQHNPFFCSVYGHPYIQTPNLQELADQGLVADSAYCPSPLCAPSRASYFTGKRVHEIQAQTGCFLKSDYDGPVFPKLLRDQGFSHIVGINDQYKLGLSHAECFQTTHDTNSQKHLCPNREDFMILNCKKPH
jgi:choline-sulfatase